MTHDPTKEPSANAQVRNEMADSRNKNEFVALMGEVVTITLALCVASLLVAGTAWLIRWMF